MPKPFHLVDPDYVADPYGTWAELRDDAPVFYNETDRLWMVTRYDDVVAILHDPERFSSKGGATGRFAESGIPRQTLIQDDPPHHDRLRRILSAAFTPRITAEREDRLREIAAGLIDELRARLADGEPVDLVRHFTSPFPVNVIAEILGIPKEMHERLLLWNATSSVAGAAEITYESMPAVMQEMANALAELIEARRSDRRDDLFSALIDASEHDESPLSSEELVGLCQLLWAAGNETTTNLLSNAALQLQARPELQRVVRDEPDRIPKLVTELLRLESPVNCLARVATTDVEMHGQTIREDDVLMLVFAAANRDPRHFANPDAIDLDRRPNDHVAFGHGIHYCLGSHLARLEARIGLEELARLLPDVRVCEEQGERIPIGILHGWLTLPLEAR